MSPTSRPFNQGLGLNMSSFRAINRPPESPAKRNSGERPQSNVVSRQDGELGEGQAPNLTQATLATPNANIANANIAKRQEYPEVVVPAKRMLVSPKEDSREQVQSSPARPWAAVVPQGSQSSSQSNGKDNIRQHVAKAKKALRTLRKKNSISKSLTPGARRQQFPREKKLMPSIEHSARKRRASSTDSAVNGAAESDYIPSSTATTDTSAATTPVRRSSPKHSSTTCPAAGSSGSAQSSSHSSDMPVEIERKLTPESSPKLEATLTPSPGSPSIWSSPLRAKRYEEAEFAELPREVYELEETEKEMRQQLKIKKEAVRAGKRKEKGKVVERRDKRSAEGEAEQGESRKRQKSRNPGLEDQSTTNGSSIASEEARASSQADVRTSPEGKSQEKQLERYKAVVIKAEDRSDIIDVRSHERQEICLPNVPRKCSCAALDEFFTSMPNRVPSRAKWRGGSLEFFVHVKQISCCRGHPPNVIDACRRMLRKHGDPSRGDEESLELKPGSTNESLSTNDRDDDRLRRAQSSIPPPTFYGYPDSYRPARNARTSSRSASATRKPRSVEESSLPRENSSEFHPRKKLVVHERIKDPINPTSTSDYLHSSSRASSPTLSDSSPLGKKRRADVPSHRFLDCSHEEEEGVPAVRRISNVPPDASSKRPEPPISFSDRRTRHQSAPVDLYRRPNAINDCDSSPQPKQRRRENPLREMSNNLPSHAIQGLHRKMDSLLERLPAPLTTSSNTLVQPLSAQTAATDVGGGSGAEQFNVRKRKRLSAAERKLRYPELSSDVLDDLRKSDEQIIEIGRIVSPYERHRSAPEAFGYRGHLRAEYNGLLEKVENGVLVWTAKQIRRLTR